MGVAAGFTMATDDAPAAGSITAAAEPPPWRAPRPGKGDVLAGLL